MKQITTTIGTEIANLLSVNTFVTTGKLEGKETVRVTKDPKVEAVDEPTFARLIESDFKDGIIEVKVLSKLLEDAPDHARGFIGVAFRIDESNSKFECIYIRQPMAGPKTSCKETTLRNISHIQNCACFR